MTGRGGVVVGLSVNISFKRLLTNMKPLAHSSAPHENWGQTLYKLGRLLRLIMLFSALVA